MSELSYEYNRLLLKVDEYDEQDYLGKFTLPEINFETEISKIDFQKLRTGEIHHFDPNDFEIVFLNINKVVRKIRHDYNAIYSTEKLFVMKEFTDTARLIEFIKEGNKLIPPIIELVGYNISVRDGNHRIGLLRYLSYETVPFLIKKHLSEKVSDLK